MKAIMIMQKIKNCADEADKTEDENIRCMWKECAELWESLLFIASICKKGERK